MPDGLWHHVGTYGFPTAFVLYAQFPHEFQMAAAGQKIVGLAHQLGIAGEIDLAGAGARTVADLVEQAGPGAAFEKRESILGAIT